MSRTLGHSQKLLRENTETLAKLIDRGAEHTQNQGVSHAVNAKSEPAEGDRVCNP